MNNAAIKVLPVVLALAGCAVDEAATSAEEPGEQASAKEVTGTTTAGLLAADTCKNTVIILHNQHEVNGVEYEVEIRNAQYHSVSEGTSYTEDLANTVIPFGWRKTWSSEDLAHVENDELDWWKVDHRHRVPGGAWASWTTVGVDIGSQTCVANMVFDMTLH